MFITVAANKAFVKIFNTQWKAGFNMRYVKVFNIVQSSARLISRSMTPIKKYVLSQFDIAIRLY